MKLSGHFVYTSVTDMAGEAPPLRCTNRQRVMEWLAGLGAREPADEHEVLLPELSAVQMQQLLSDDPMWARPALDRCVRNAAPVRLLRRPARDEGWPNKCATTPPQALHWLARADRHAARRPPLQAFLPHRCARQRLRQGAHACACAAHSVSGSCCSLHAHPNLCRVPPACRQMTAAWSG